MKQKIDAFVYQVRNPEFFGAGVAEATILSFDRLDEDALIEVELLAPQRGRVKAIADPSYDYSVKRGRVTLHPYQAPEFKQVLASLVVKTEKG